MLNKLDFEKEVKRAKSLLKTPEGRKAVEEVYGLTIKDGEPETVNELPIVAVLIPCYRQPHPQMQHAFAAMTEFTRKAGVCAMYPTPIIQTSVVHWTRNELIATLIRSGRPFTHVLFLDDDVAPPADALVKLLSHKKDIVAALCTRRQDPAIPNMRLLNIETNQVGEVWKWTEGTLLGDELPPNHALTVGTGMMLISRECLQKTADAHLNCDYEKDLYGLTDEKLTDEIKRRTELFDTTGNGWWFRFRSPQIGKDEFGEDIYFCWQAFKYAGFKTYVDSGVLPSHWGDYGYSIPDYLAEREYALKVAKEKGWYIPPALQEKEPDAIQVIG